MADYYIVLNKHKNPAPLIAPTEYETEAEELRLWLDIVMKDWGPHSVLPLVKAAKED